MRFSIAELLVAMLLLNLLLCLSFAALAWIGYPVLTLISLIVVPPIVIVGMVNTRGPRQAFFLGSTVAGLRFWTSMTRLFTRWRFSLSSTLIALTLIVMALVFFVEPYLRIKRQNNAIEVLYSQPESLKRDDSGNVTAIQCGNRNSGGDLVVTIPIEKVTAFHELESFHLSNVAFGSLESISKLKNLETLRVYDCSVKNLKGVSELQVTHFILESEKQAGQFPEMPKLKRLTLGNMGSGFWLTLSDNENGQAPRFLSPPKGYDFHQLKNYRTASKVDLLLLEITSFNGFEKFEKLDSLILHGCELFSFEGLEDLVSLTSIEFSQISPNAPDLLKFDLAPLQKCKLLQELVFPTSAPEEVVKHYQNALPKCKVFAQEE